MSAKFTPRPWQQNESIPWVLEKPRCALFLRMGMGKTATVLSALCQLSQSEKGIWPTLVIAPRRVALSVWPGEVSAWEDFCHLQVSAIVGTAQDRLSALSRKAHIYTVNYENLPWLVEHCEKTRRWPFRTVIADESTRLKSYRLRQGGARAQALSRVIPFTRRWVNLSGRPSPNGLQDLWGQTYFLDQGQRLGRSFNAFSNRWFHSTYDGFGIIPNPGADAEIQARIADICLYVDPKDYFDLGLPVEHTIYVELPIKVRKLYRDMEKKMYMEIEGEGIEAWNAAARTGKCLQIAQGAVYLEDKTWSHLHDEKLDALEDVIEEAAGAPVMVAYYYKHDLERLRKRFPKGRELDSEGKTERAWNKGEVPLLFVHPASAGHGLNLQHGGNILCFFGHDWNLESYEQIIERIGPMRQMQSGYERNVFIYHIVTRDTVEEAVMERLASKASVQDILLRALIRKKEEL